MGSEILPELCFWRGRGFSRKLLIFGLFRQSSAIFGLSGFVDQDSTCQQWMNKDPRNKYNIYCAK